MALSDLLADLRGDHGFMANVAAWHTQPARPARTAAMPPALHPLLAETLSRRGIDALYTHQAAAVDLALTGRNVAVVTPTASGKTLCYNLPVLHELVDNHQARALYLFPTKALAQDQLAELMRLTGEIEEARLEIGAGIEPAPTGTNRRPDRRSSAFNLSVATYDGDTPSAHRARIRRTAQIILSNPDMLHAGILPYHGNWADFFQGLRYVIIDEMHVYRGVFGSHVANVLRRLRRICRFYDSAPRFILASATIANPGELAARLIEQDVAVVAENGAPQGEKQIILYNPPVYDAERGLRRSSMLETQALAARAVSAGIQTIVFGRSRLTTELLLSYLREQLSRSATPADGLSVSAGARLALSPSSIRGYRGGYLPGERREIEAGLRTGQVRGVVATNALELGIDIGELQAAVLCGYPGSIAATWQQMGRAGRTQAGSLAVLVATGGVLDQYVIQHPDYIFERTPEHALINADNLMLLVDQLRCAAFELPFSEDETFGAESEAVLALLTEQGDLVQAGPRRLWSGAGYPAQEVSLRSAGRDTVVIEAVAGADLRVIGEIDRAGAPMLVHDGAIYLHEGQSYAVERLDLAEARARVVPTQADFYTVVTAETGVDVLAIHAELEREGARICHGDLLVRRQVVGYRRVKRFTHETLGVFPLTYEPMLLETTGYWFSPLPETERRLAEQGLWYDSRNDYGPNWQEQRSRVRARDGYRCTQCGAPEQPHRQHDVHHLIPFRTFGYVAGINDRYRTANRLENLALVCRTCHQRLESSVRVRTGLDGVAYALGNLAPLHLMCDPSDLGSAVVRGSAHATADATPPADLSTLYIYEQIAAGLGFSARLFELHPTLIDAAAGLVSRCRCPHGCPACVGPVLEHEQARLETKSLALALLDALRPTSQ